MDISHFKTEAEYVAQMHTGALLNPRIDSTFKALFSQPTEESREALRSFLEAATERKITSVKLSANNAPAEFAGQRGVSYDILCEFADGLSADIEMQAFNQKYDYGKRAEYQVARLETTYLKRGDDWENAPQVYQITVLDFNYVPKGHEKDSATTAKAPVSRYAMRTSDGRELSDTLNIIFIELPKAASLEETVETNSPLENWAIFLRNADNPAKQGIIQKLTEKEAGLMNARKSLSSISANQDLWIAQYRQELFERDRRSSISAAKREGRMEGRAEGRLEGSMTRAIESAQKMLADGIPATQIAKWTGLSAEEISRL